MAGYIITVHKNATLDSVEEYYNVLYKAINLDLTVDVFLPSALNQSYLGLVPALLQFVISWSRYPKIGNLILDLDDTTELAIDELYKNEIIFPSVVFIWNSAGIVTAKGQNLKGILNVKNRQFMAKMMAGDAIAHKLLLTNFDHLSDDLQLPCFGNKYDFVSSEYQLLQNLKNGISDVFYYVQVLPEFVSLYPDIVAIIYELMKNTFEWGKEDEYNVPLETNIRGVFFKFFKKRRENLLKEYEGHKGLQAYFSSDELKENVQGELYFIEISIFDGGIGFARKYKSMQNRPCELSEIEILKTCLIKHMTSSKGLEKSDKGIGLDQILKVLNTKGFLIIKTGELCVYRDLIKDPRLENSDPNKMIINDWKTHTNKRYSSFKRSEGALITIIYPLAINV